MPKRKAVLTAFNASPQFVQQLISRARLATNVDRVNLEVKKMPLGSQQLGGMRLINRHSFSEHFQQLENGARLTLRFGRDSEALHPFRTLNDDEESQDEFRFEPKDPFNMARHIREDALLRLADALLDVGCFLDRFEVDSIQCLTWKSHTYLANKSHVLPARLLHTAVIASTRTYVTARDGTRSSVSPNGTPLEKFHLALAAIKDSNLKYLSLFDPTGEPISDEELAQIAAVAPSVKIRGLRLYGQLTHLSPAALHCLMFSFSSVQELTLNRFRGNQLTDEHLRDCGRRQIWRLHVITEEADAGPLAFSDEALLDFLFTPEYEMPTRAVILTAFNASPQFVQKLASRAHLATNVDRIDLQVDNLPLGSQQVGGVPLTTHRGFAELVEQLEDGTRLRLQFRGMICRKPQVPVPLLYRMQDNEEESDDKFCFTLSK